MMALVFSRFTCEVCFSVLARGSDDLYILVGATVFVQEPNQQLPESRLEQPKNGHYPSKEISWTVWFFVFFVFSC